MLRWQFLVSLLVVASSACRSGPRVTVCVLDPANLSLQCSDADGNGFTLPVNEAENFVCFSPEDTNKLLKACTKPGAL